MCQSTPTPVPGVTNPTPLAPPLVDLDELSTLVDRCRRLALGLQIVMSGAGLPPGPDREGLCYELASIIEESAQKAYRLAAAL